MLIQSDRHRPEDLAIWREQEEGDLAHKICDAKLASARGLVERFAAEPCYASTSWGKDSVVVAHIVRTVSPQVPIVFIHTKRTVPGCDDVQKAFLQQYPGPLIVIHEPDSGWPHWGFGIPIAVRIFGDRAIHGVRADESGMRALSANVHGPTTQRMCRPLLRWTDQDVFAYLAQHNLPVHPSYAMNGGGRWDRGRLRVGSIGGERGAAMGRREWEWEYYGDVIRRLESTVGR